MEKAIKTLLKEIKKTLTENEIKDLAHVGAENGFNGFSNYEETIRFFNKFKKEIYKILVLNCKTYDIVFTDYVTSLNKNFTKEDVLKFLYLNDKTNETQIKNAIVWHILEIVADYYLEYLQK